jgi:hypothetical protein
MMKNITEGYQIKWEEISSIRNRPRKIIDFNLSGDLFPRDKQILLTIPELSKLNENVKTDILIYSLHKYLSDIVTLEQDLIINVSNKLIKNNLVIPYEKFIITGAYTIIIDEYYHAYIAQDMLNQIHKNHTHLEHFVYPISDSYRSVIEIKQNLDEKFWDIFEIIAVSIFETTLIRELIEYFNSPGLHPSIRYYINDHMNDEARHYSFFHYLLKYTWEHIPPNYREAIANIMLTFIISYLNIVSEKEFNMMLLDKILPENQELKKSINNLYQGFQISAEIPIVKNVIKVLYQTHILDDPIVNASFKQYNLI